MAQKKMTTKPITKAEHFSDVQGEVTCRISDENAGYGIAIDDLNRQVSSLYAKLKDHAQSITKCLHEVSGHCKSLAETATRIKTEYEIFNGKVSYAKSQLNSNIIDSLSNCFNGWAVQIKDQSRVIDKYISSTISWTELELEAQNEVRLK